MKLRFSTTLAVAAALLLSSSLPAAEAIAPAGGALIEQGDKLWADGKTDQAKASFEQAVAAAPRSAEARMKLAGLLLTTRHYAEAVRAYQDVIAMDSGNAKPWIGMGLAYRHSGEKELSRAAFAEAIRVEPARKAQLAGLVD